MLTFLSQALPAASNATAGLRATAKSAGLGNEPKDVEVLTGQIISAVLGLLGLVFLALMIYGGFLWMTGSQGGKEDQIGKAKAILRNAVIGLIIIGAAYAITNFVIGSVGNVVGGG